MSEGDSGTPLATRAPETASEIAVQSQGGPVVAQARLRTLAARPQLLPAEAEPARAAPATMGWRWLFVLTVVLPMAVASTYLLAFAAPRYASTTSFIVRSTDSQSQDPFAALQQGAGMTIARDETNAIQAYLTSRDVVAELVKNNDLRAILSRASNDFLFRYPTFWLKDDTESLYKRFQWMADVDVDSSTSISTIEVNAFTAEDARAIALALLGFAEGMVNQLNERTYRDGLAVAGQFVAEARRQLDSTENALQAFRNASGSVDPGVVAQSKLTVIAGLETELAQIEATIAQQAKLAPNSPSLSGLHAQADSFHKEIEKRTLEIAGSARSEAEKLEQYEKLVLMRDLAGKALANAEQERNQAQQDKERQHLYVQMISRPNLSFDFARYPRVTLDLLVLLALCLGVFQLIRLLGGIAAEHRP